jgi:two-component system response regulator YesN
MDGLQVAAELRKRNPEVKTILITGYPSSDLEQQAAGQPQTTYIAKPFESQDILAAVIRALSQSE